MGTGVVRVWVGCVGRLKMGWREVVWSGIGLFFARGGEYGSCRI